MRFRGILFLLNNTRDLKILTAMPVKRCLPSPCKGIMILFLLLLCISTINANKNDYKGFAEVYITVKESSTRLLQIFKLIEKQTPLVFVYDESEISLTHKLKLPVGEQPLSNLLNSISDQTGLAFTQKQNTILVSRKVVLSQTKIILSTIPVKGSVNDAAGNPLPGATVSIKGTKISVQTDSNGNFSLNAPENAVLIISYTGYMAQEVAVNGRTRVDINIKKLGKGLDEVVVVGYQSQKRAAISGAVSTINPDDVAKLPVGFADQALQGQAAGVVVTQNTGQPGDGVAINIRGIGSIGSSTQPLFIVDGVPTSDGINFLPADDIASITVLKDAASAAIYGSRSNNGVIIITTKSGKNGKPQLSYSVYAGIQTHGFLTPMTNAAEYKTLFNEMTVNDNVGLAPTNPNYTIPIPDTLAMANTNWLGSIFQNAPIQDHEISLSGGNEKTQYALSVNALKQDGIILNSWYERYTLRLKINTEVSDRLKVGTSLNLSYYDKNAISSSGDGYAGNGGSVVRYALFRDPAYPIYNPDGSYFDYSPQNVNFFENGYNPVGLANNTSNLEAQFRTFGNVFAEYKLFKNLVFRSDFGGDVLITEDKVFNKTWGLNGRINSPNQLNEGITTNLNYTWNNTFRFNKTFNEKHSLNVLVGTEAVENSTHTVAVSVQNLPNQDPSFQFLGLTSSPAATVPAEALSQWSLLSFLASINYGYNNEFFATINARRDGSSRLDPSQQWGNFFSGSVAWNLLKVEKIAGMLPDVSLLKLRGSWGQNGNQNIPSPYTWASLVTNSGNYVLGSTPASVQGYTVSTLGEPNVHWETATQTDGGLDVGIFQDKLTFTVDYFVKTISNMLLNAQIPLIGGSATPPYQNNGSVQNKGFEFQLIYKNNDHKLKFSFNANFATLQNKVLSLLDNQPIYAGRINTGINATLTEVGHPIGSFYGYQMDGIFQNAEQIESSAYQGQGIRPGDVKYKDINGDGKIDANDQTFLGSAIPKFTYGLISNLSYSNFDISIFFQGSYGNKIYMQVNQDIEGFYRGFNLTQNVYNTRWHGEGTSNTMPLVSWNDAANNVLEPSSRFLKDGSYVRLKNAQLGYSFPRKLSNRIGLKGLRIYATGNNLLTFTKYPGLDPEMTTSTNTNSEKYPGLARGIDWGTYPSSKSYILGLNVNF
jgi:TonB-dependent starch-binding outer membrane protein SusC